MIKKPAYLFILVTLLNCVLLGCFSSNEEQARSLPDAPVDAKKYAVTYTHKGSKSDKALTNTLYKLQNESEEAEQGEQARYFMDVASVFCGENVCKIDKVRLFWNELGFYDHLELAKGGKLEKGEALDFEPEDYLKLEQVLSNTESGLKLLDKHELVSNQSGGNAVDALTGATVSLHKNDYIKGAIWTCYTLWHFANGDMHNIIRDFTGTNYRLSQLQEYLLKGDSRYLLFALEQIIRRKEIDEKTRELVVSSALQSQAEKTSLPTLKHKYIDYAEQLSPEYYFSVILKFITSNDNKLRWLALKSLEASNKSVPFSYLLTLSRYLSKFDSYQQINLFLTILRSQQAYSDEINEQLVNLLQHKNFIIARATFWALSEQQISNKVQQQLATFEHKYGYKL